MDVSQFQDHLDRYGGDLGAWPPELRRQATALMTTSQPARAAFQAMGELEAILHASLLPASGTADAMAARAMQHPQIRPVPVFARRAAWSGAAAAALALGLFVGNLSPRHEESPDRIMAAAFDSAGSIDVD